jgi:HEPN domain-containing protein
MNRSDLQALAELRLTDARVLFDAGAFSASYYLAGYSIECALKACVAKQVKEFDFPDKRFVERSYTHNLTQLLDVAGLKSIFETAAAENDLLDWNWSVIKEWSESSRYAVDISARSAQDMLAALGDETNGVLPWLKRFW